MKVKIACAMPFRRYKEETVEHAIKIIEESDNWNEVAARIRTMSKHEQDEYKKIIKTIRIEMGISAGRQ